MIRRERLTFAVFASGMIGLGILGLIYGDFAMQWQPVDPWVPARKFLAYASAVLMLLIGVGLLYRQTVKWSVRILFPYLLTWQLLKVPALCVAPRMEAAWLGFGEIAVLLSGGWTLFAQFAQLGPDSRFLHFSGERGVTLARLLFAISLIPIGLSHLLYTKLTVTLIPAWIPFRTVLAILTGIMQIICGLGSLMFFLARITATVETATLTLFALLIWIPAVISAPSARLPWTALLITWAIAASSWVMASSAPVISPVKKGREPVSASTLEASHL